MTRICKASQENASSQSCYDSIVCTYMKPDRLDSDKVVSGYTRPELSGCDKLQVKLLCQFSSDARLTIIQSYAGSLRYSSSLRPLSMISERLPASIAKPQKGRVYSTLITLEYTENIYTISSELRPALFLP